MKRSALFFLLAVACPAFLQAQFNTSAEISAIEIITAEAASVEQLSDRVAVFLIGPDKTQRLGLEIAVTSTAKHVAVRARAVGGERVSVYKRKSNGRFFFFGNPGRYEIEIIEFDPERGINFTDEVGEIKPTPGDPTKPPPPGDFANLIKLASEKLRIVNDPATAILLGKAIRSTASQFGDKSLADCQSMIRAARFATLNSRPRDTLLINWRAFLEVVDAELAKIPLSPQSYAAACRALADVLDPQ